MKKILFLSACVWAMAAAPGRAQTAPPSIAIVRLDERGTTKTAYITTSEGGTEKVLIKTGLAGADKTEQLMGEGYRAIFQKLYQQGYVLQTSFTVPTSSASGIPTLVFVKK